MIPICTVAVFPPGAPLPPLYPQHISLSSTQLYPQHFSVTFQNTPLPPMPPPPAHLCFQHPSQHTYSTNTPPSTYLPPMLTPPSSTLPAVPPQHISVCNFPCPPAQLCSPTPPSNHLCTHCYTHHVLPDSLMLASQEEYIVRAKLDCLSLPTLPHGCVYRFSPIHAVGGQGRS